MTATNFAEEGRCSNNNSSRLANRDTSFLDGDAPTSATDNMPSSRHKTRRLTLSGAALVVLSTVFLPLAAAQTSSSGNCISLSGSRTCPAYNESSISTSSSLTGEYPFLAYVSSTEQFDTQFEQYIKQDYAKNKYQNLFGCSNLTLSNTTELYARYTRSVLCSRMIQDSRTACSLTTAQSAPICADACAQFAISEQIIISNRGTCGSTNQDALGLIRSDFTICALPSDSLNSNCVPADENETTNCGYNDNLPGLCLYCATNSPNSTDTCCYNSNAETRCENVDLPTITSLPPIFTTTAVSSSTSTSSSGASGSSGGSGLTGGQIAGITIGAVAGVALGVMLILLYRRRQRYGNSPSTFNQPSRQHRTPSMTFNPVAATGVQAQGYEVLTGRIARMSALEGTGGASDIDLSSPGVIGGARRGHIRLVENSSSSDFGLEDSLDNNQPRRYSPGRPLHPPPRDRNASLSSTSILMSDNSSPVTRSDRDMSSPGYSSPQSEQLPYFKDYYSQDDIHPGDKVAVLWAYQPRAADEFDLDRGDMLKVVGIWDDGWATGIRLNERAEDYVSHRQLRDSGVSAHTSRASQRRSSSPPPGIEIKAFPLVCVCLPEHWQKTIDNDPQGSDFTGFSGDQPGETASGRLHDEDPRTPDRRITQKGSSRFREDLNVPRSGTTSSPATF
ncbi:hypothetical protein DFP73DRAFT_88776 [Morchella snyderi]|nr:hypothetical protein DFP73DRAFT_88776 [Morchella snyderi]